MSSTNVVNTQYGGNPICWSFLTCTPLGVFFNLSGLKCSFVFLVHCWGASSWPHVHGNTD